MALLIKFTPELKGKNSRAFNKKLETQANLKVSAAELERLKKRAETVLKNARI